MPGGDRTGPRGMGPMTGRGLGYCSGSGVPGYAVGFGRGLGIAWGRGGYGGRGTAWGRGGYGGRGMGIGFGGRWMAPVAPWGGAPVAPVGVMDPVDELGSLKATKEAIEGQIGGMKEYLDQLGKRIAELEKKE